MMKRLSIAAAILATAALASPASAATATFTSDHCSGGGCGNGSATGQPGGFGTITAIDLGGGSIDISIALNNGNSFSNGGFPLTFGFNLVGDPTITYSGLPSSFEVTNGFNIGMATGNNSQIAGNYHQDGFGNFEYGVDLTTSGSSGPKISTLDFIINGAGLTLASFAELSGGMANPSAFFVLDILSGTTNKTGLVDCCVGQGTPFEVNPVPLPGALPLFISGLVGLGWISKRRKDKFKKNGATISA
jgi:hypothetical protein